MRIKSIKEKVDGITFDSKTEARYYEYLKDQKRKGKVKGFKLQPKYELQPTFKKDGKTYRAITYTPDFLVTYKDGSTVAIDVKGLASQQGLLRRKMFLYKYDVPLLWIASSYKYGTDGWIDYDELQKIRRKAKR